MPSPRSSRLSSVSVSTGASRSICCSSGGSSLPVIAYSRMPVPASRCSASSSHRVRVCRIRVRKTWLTASGRCQMASSSSSVVRYG